MNKPQNTPVLDNEDTSHDNWSVTSYRQVLMLVLVLLGLALLLTVEWPSFSLHLTAFQSPLIITLSLVWPMVGFLTAAMALVAALIFRQHPSIRRGAPSELVALWPLPALTVGLAAWLLQRTTSSVLWAGGIGITGLLLYALFRLEYICLTDRRYLSVRQAMERPKTGNLWAEWSLQAIAYLLALIYFVLIYQGRLRTLLSAPAMLTVGGLLALRLLHGLTADRRKEGVSALAIGLILGESTWALNYWPNRGIVGSVLLLLIFYVIIGLARRSLEDRLTKSVMVEYAVVATLGLAFLLRFG